jgi:hypothetical protein
MTATAPSWPRWEITGPATGVSIHNATTGETLEWAGIVAEGETLRIDTEEERTSVRIGAVNAWLGLSDDSEFWPLKPGRPGAPQMNEVFVSVSGAAGTTSARMILRSQWLSPW